MRPVNLIPPEQRRGERAPSRTGNKMYLVLGGLAAVLLGLALIVTTGNSISDRKAEKKQLQGEKSTLEAQSAALRHYADFAQLEAARQQTVTSLAQSRFDWERVVRELSLILPPDVWLIKVSGTVSPDVKVDNDAAITIRDTVDAPAIELVGCGRSQDSVARFVAALHDIGGVTRVTVNKSDRSRDDSAAQASAGAASGGGSSLTDDCRTRDSVSQFEIVVAFDNVQAGAAVAAAAASAAPVATSANGIGDAQAQQASAAAATSSATQQAKDASKIVPGT
jgi:Tfp pilus assembly protein PilN